MAGSLLLPPSHGSAGLTYRIHRSATADAVVFALSGDMDTEHATRLQEFLANEGTGPIALDLIDVTIVDRAAVRFLVGVEAAGVRLVNCPDYVRSWIAAERENQEQWLQEPDDPEPKQGD